MAVFSDALVMQIRGDSSHLLGELQRSRLALATLRRDFQQFQGEQALAVSRNLALANSRSASSARGGALGTSALLPSLGVARLARGGAVPAVEPASIFARQGTVGGMAGTDRVPALLSAGEFVMSRRAVERLGVRFMEQINARRFQNGGLVGSVSDSLSSLLPGPSLTFGPFPTTQEGRLRFLGIDALPDFLNEALRLFDLGKRTGDPSFLRLGFPIQQTLATFRLLLSDRNRQAARNVLSPLDTELSSRPDALRAVLSLVAAPELRIELLRLLGFENPQRKLAGLLNRQASPFEGTGTAQDPFQIDPASAAAVSSPSGTGAGPPAPTGMTNNFGGIQIHVRNATAVGDIVRQLQRRGATGRLRRGG